MSWRFGFQFLVYKVPGSRNGQHVGSGRNGWGQRREGRRQLHNARGGQIQYGVAGRPVYFDALKRAVPADIHRQLQAAVDLAASLVGVVRSEEHTSELQSLLRISYAVFCL